MTNPRSVEQKENSSKNINSSTLAASQIHKSMPKFTEGSVANITPDLCSTSNMQQDDGILLPSRATEASPDSIVSSPSSVSLHPLMPMIQGVSSYVTSFLKCNNSFPVIEGQEENIGGRANRNMASKRVALLDTDFDS
jgi:hypothetical protein